MSKAKFLLRCTSLIFSLSATIAAADINASRTALAQKNYPLAIQEAAKSQKSNPYEAAILISRSLLELGRPVEAEKLARMALKLAPNGFAARFLLGTALRHQNKNLASEFHLRRALDVANTPLEKQMARNAMAYVERTKNWTTSFTLGVAPTTNVSKKSDAQYLGIQLLSFGIDNLPNQEKTSSDRGVFYGLNLGRKIALENSSLRLSVGQVKRDYKDNSYNSKNTTLSAVWIGKQINNAQNYLRFDRTLSDYFGARYSQSNSVTAGRSFQSFGARSANVSLTYNVENLSNSTTRNTGTTVKFGHDLWVGTTYRFGASIALFDKKSNNLNNRSDGYDIGMNLDYVPAGSGWQFNAGLTYGREIWDEKNPLFIEKRSDSEWVTTVGVQNRNLSFLGLTPTFSYTYQKRNSAVDFYDLKSGDYFIGVTNAF